MTRQIESVGIAGIAFLVGGAGIYSAFLILGFNLPRVAWVLTAVVLGWCFRRNLKPFAVAVSAALLLPAVFQFTHDFTFDGQMYQGPAILALRSGWNPVWSAPMDTLSLERGYFFPAMVQINSFPKASWYSAVLLGSWFAAFEAGKAVLMFLATAVALYVGASFRRWGMNVAQSAAFAFLGVFSPVVAVQIFSFMNDGTLGVSLFALLVAAVNSYTTKERHHQWLVVLLAAFAMNTKYSGLVFVLLLVAGLALWEWQGRNRKKVVRWALGGVALGVLVLGANPFVTNAFRHGNPLYPVAFAADSQWKKRNSDQYPANFSRAWRFFKTSFLSRSANIFPDDLKSSTAKIPFAFRREEIHTFVSPDSLLAGYGPWFSGLCLFALLGVLGLRRSLAKKWRFAFAVALGTVFSMLLPIYSALYVARLSPPLWLLPFVAVLPFFLSAERTARWFGTAFLGVAAVNLSMVLPPALLNQKNLDTTLLRETQFLKSIGSKKPLEIVFHDVNFNEVRLREAGVPFGVRSSDCESATSMVNSFGLTYICAGAWSPQERAAWNSIIERGDPAQVTAPLMKGWYYRLLEL